MRKCLPLLVGLCLVAACSREPAEPPVAAVPDASSKADARSAAKAAAETKVAARAARQALKTGLPENFELPFNYRRMYDNSVRRGGKQERRIMVEFIGIDAKAAQAALTSALEAKGFASSAPEQNGSITQLKFIRPDGAAVALKIDSKPKRLVAKDARGTLHMVWDPG
jgi:hypothetical protein